MTPAPARFGIVFLPESLTGFGKLCREAEVQGFFDRLGVADSQSVFRELYVALTLAALTGFVPDPRAFMRRWMKEVAGAL